MSQIPVLDSGGGFIYRHYRISAHAVDRYRERITDRVEQLFEDLDSAFLVEESRTKGRLRGIIRHNARMNGYGLMSGDAVFLVVLEGKLHHITTIVTARETNGRTNYR